MNNNITFEKAVFGGFKRECVMDYISALTDEFYRYKKDTVNKAEEAKRKINELEQAYNALLTENEALKAELAKINDEEERAESRSESVKALIESLTESMNVLIDVLSGEEREEILSSVSENNESNNEKDETTPESGCEAALCDEATDDPLSEASENKAQEEIPTDTVASANEEKEADNETVSDTEEATKTEATDDAVTENENCVPVELAIDDLINKYLENDN